MGAFGSDSMFESMFGGGDGFGESSSYQQQGASKKVSLAISLEEAMSGVEKELAIHRYNACAKCAGKGSASSQGIKKCPRCSGRGQVVESRGFFSMSMPCPQCRGEGSLLVDPCGDCQGEGRVRDKSRVKVRVPAGVDDGMRLRLSGYGDVGPRGGMAGDLYVYIQVQPHAIFQRQGNDLLLELPINFTEAALGCKKEIPVLKGHTVRLSVPEGTQSGKTFRIRGEGFPQIQGSGSGDLLVTVLLETPVKLSAEQRKLLEEFQNLENPNNFPKKKGFLDKIKAFFGELKTSS
jgi:molecular chaperone DnaJ